MPENVACPNCSRALQVAENLLGKKVKCPACQTIFMAGEGQGVGAPPSRPTPGAPDDDYEDNFDEEGRPRRRLDDDLAEIPTNFTLDVGKWFSIAGAHYTSVLGPMIGMMCLSPLLMLPAILVFGCLVVAVFRTGGAGVALVSFMAGYVILVLLASALSYILFGGFSKVCLAQLKGEDWAFNDFFAGFKRLGDLFVIAVVNTVISLVCSIPNIGTFVLLGSVANPALGLGYLWSV